VSRAAWIALAGVLLGVSLAGIGWAVAASPHAAIGGAAIALLVVSVTSLTLVLVRQRRRLDETRLELARSRVRADACVDASPDGIVVLEKNGRIASANPAFRSLLAIPPDKALARRHVVEFVAADERDRVAAWIRERLAGVPEPDRLAFRGVRVTGLEVPLEASSARLPARHGATQLALFLRDVSHRRVVEDRLRHLDRVEALADIARSVALEFESILRRIRSTARESGDSLEPIERLSSRGLALVRRIRSFAPGSLPSPARSPIEVRRLVRELVTDFARARGDHGEVRLIDDADESPLVVRGQPAQLRNVLWEVLQNAAEAEPEGTILLRVRGRALGEADVERHPGGRSGDWVVVEIKDEGPGMDDSVRARAFEPFFTTKGGRASGLGLTSAFATTRAHGGFVEIDAEPGRGTIVRLALPRSDEPQEVESTTPVPSASSPEELARGFENVLVVDDDPAGRLAATESLERFGYHVESAPTPRDALQRMRQRPAVDLVLLDLVLPGWSGLEVLRRIQRIWPGQRVVMLAPYPLPDQEAQALQLGAAGTARRPLSDLELARIVRGALDRPPSMPPPVPDDARADSSPES
jgi:hypothetical protein